MQNSKNMPTQKVTTLLLFLFLFHSSYSLFGQISEEKQFPQAYFGKYKGLLEINTVMGVQKVPMEFWLQPTDSVGKYNYVIVYGEGEKRQERNYNLIARDEKTGSYLIDENNGILLEAKVFENRLYSLYEVSGNLLTTFITFEENQLLFEITVAKTEKGLTTQAKEEGIEVVSYPVTTRQKALLYKY